MSEIKSVGDHVRLNKDYDFAGGKYAGNVVEITEVDSLVRIDDEEDAALVYIAQMHARGEIVATGIPVLPSDIDDTYDHYEAQRAAFWNGAVANITGEDGAR